MKKRTLFATGLSLCLLLTACGGQPTKNPADTTNPSQVNAPSSTAVTSSAEARQSVFEATIATFGSSHTEFMEAIKPSAQKTYPSLFSEEPTAHEHEASDTLPAALSYSYPVGNAAAFVLYDVKDSEELYEVFLSFDISKENETSIQEIGLVNGLMMAALEPDQNVRQQIDQQLNCSNVTEDAVTFASGTAADWTYIVNGSSISLMATAK